MNLTGSKNSNSVAIQNKNVGELNEIEKFGIKKSLKELKKDEQMLFKSENNGGSENADLNSNSKEYNDKSGWRSRSKKDD